MGIGPSGERDATVAAFQKVGCQLKVPIEQLNKVPGLCWTVLQHAQQCGFALE